MTGGVLGGTDVRLLWHDYRRLTRTNGESGLPDYRTLECIDLFGSCSACSKHRKMKWSRFLKPSAIGRRCSSRPLVSSTGPLDNPSSKKRWGVIPHAFQGVS